MPTHKMYNVPVFFCHLLDVINVRKLFMKSKTTSCTLEPMPTKLVKQYIAELLPLLMHIINLSVAAGEFPQEWKTAFVVPLHK